MTSAKARLTLVLLTVALAILQTPPGFRPVGHFRKVADANLPRRDWHVGQVKGQLRVETEEVWRKRRDKEYKGWKPAKNGLKVKLENATGFWSPGDGAKVVDGWIQGYSAGEFGGGLFWFSKNGKRQQKIDGSNTDAVESFPGGVYAIQSLDHLMFWYSRLVRVDRKPTGWTASTVTDLHTVPRMVVRDRNRFVYMTDEYVSTLETDGRQREIFRWLWEFKPGTMVRLDNGDLWLGGERTILSLHPKPDGTYREQWYVPVGAK